MSKIRKKLSIDEVAEKEVSRLSKEDKAFLLKHPDYYEHHFGYGMYLRNEYIHSGILEMKDEDGLQMLYIADDLSELLFNRVIKKLKKRIVHVS